MPAFVVTVCVACLAFGFGFWAASFFHRVDRQNARSSSGAAPCPQRAKVVVTETGECFHLKADCGGLKRAKSTRKLRPCKICAGGH